MTSERIGPGGASESLSLDFLADDSLSGFRLQRLEVFNWGTFDARVWSLAPDGRNALLTGDIGSGKSTLVDAVTTLLVPSQRITYNKAAGAEAKERSLRSYVLGHYKSGRGEASQSARPIALRDHNTYSVILGVFHNAAYDQTVTLAQVFWIKDPQGQPARFYAGAEHALSIGAEFARFGSDINALRKRLRGQGVEIFDSFPPYGAWFRRRFGIDNEQALELFHQTVSMKSVGNLTDFVRQHMLEPFDVAPRIQALVDHFDNLSRAHEAVLKAKRQIELLTPLVARLDEHARLQAELAAWETARDAVRPYFARLKAELLDKRLTRLEDEWMRRDRAIVRLTEARHALRATEDELKHHIAENGGDRLERLTQEIGRKTRERTSRTDRARYYEQWCQAIGESAATDEAAFLAQGARLSDKAEQARTEEANLQNALTEQSMALREARGAHETLLAEIRNLEARQSNIDSRHALIRAEICRALALAEDDMPFAGELLQVRAEESAWEGAAERLLHNFGLSLLVPDGHYTDVARWVDKTDLKGRIVYFRVRKPARNAPIELHPDSLARKLEIRPDSPFYEWLERELAQRFDVACCTTYEQFQRETRALTRAGQIKTPGDRHEKDDRHRLDDRSHYILGWSNAAKISALKARTRALESEIAHHAADLAKTQAAHTALKERLAALTRLEEYRDFRELDWRAAAAEIAVLEEEKHRLESASDALQQLTARLREVTAEREYHEARIDTERELRAKCEQQKTDTKALRQAVEAVLNEPEFTQHAAVFDQIDAVRAELQGALTLESCEHRENELRSAIGKRASDCGRRLAALRDAVMQGMVSYKETYKLETAEVDAAIEAGFEYRKMLDELLADGLPGFEARFKDLLNENTIREVTNFQSQLARERELIKERIDRVNASLTKIDYNPGRFIVLEAERTTDADIRDFQTELRACTDGTLTGSDDAQYSESKFLQVKRIIERFRGREGQSEADRRWTAKVTDVRAWFVFAASERWHEDQSEYEHYSDSGGKSGGQKEKLAYTVLAASLAYQFGLEWGATRSRSFRFVVIDEAFGRGSDESAQYGLRLFRELNLQLLIVTPLQKIHIIEPFVSCVGFVHNEDGRASKLRNLTIEEYRAEKARITG
ncbi:MAG: ATP-binding protein [Acidiferrobacter sp.]